MEPIQPLPPGQQVELDSGLTIERLEAGDQFRVDHPDFGHVVLFRDQICAMARAANYSVNFEGNHSELDKD